MGEIKYYTVEEIAIALRLSESTIYAKIRNGEIKKALFEGRAVRIPESEYKRLIGNSNETCNLEEYKQSEFEIKKSVELKENYFSGLSKEVKAMIRNELENKNSFLQKEIESNLIKIDLINKSI